MTPLNCPVSGPPSSNNRRVINKVARNDTNIQAIVFDVDDTLYPERQFVRSGYAAVTKHLRKLLSEPDDADPAQKEDFEDWLWRRFMGGETARAFNDLSEHFHLHLDDGQIGRLIEVYRFHAPDIHPFTGIAELLEQLRGRFRLGILSDGAARMQRNKLQSLGLEDAFEAVVLTDELPGDSRKPSPAGYETIRTALGVPHERCLYVADNPAKDFIAPNKLGWDTVRYRREGQIYAQAAAPPGGQAHHVVHNDSEFLNLIRGR